MFLPYLCWLMAMDITSAGLTLPVMVCFLAIYTFTVFIGPVFYGVRTAPFWKYVWNEYLLKNVYAELHCDWLLYIVHGFIGQSSILLVCCPSSLYYIPLLRYTISELWWLSGGKRGDYQNCSVLYCVLKLCTVISTRRWAVLTVLCIGFCLTGPISLCLDSFMFVFFWCLSCHTTYVLYYCNTVGWTWWDWSLILQYFDTVGGVIWPVKTHPDMTYDVFGGT